MGTPPPATRMPSLFLSHGAPTLVIEDGPAHRFLAGYGTALGKPRAVLMVSAHFEAAAPTVTSGARPGTIHDFGGFPRALYEMRYPAPGDPALARTVVELLKGTDPAPEADASRGLDHGAWVPLKLMYPDADVPVVQLSINPRRGSAWHHALGERLRPLRDQGVLIIGSGGATHNLGHFAGAGHDDPAPDWVVAFGQWLHDAIVDDRRKDLVHYRKRAPYAAENHATEDHYLPLLTAIGAAEPGGSNVRVHTSHTYGILTMDAYSFGA